MGPGASRHTTRVEASAVVLDGDPAVFVPERDQHLRAVRVRVLAGIGQGLLHYPQELNLNRRVELVGRPFDLEGCRKAGELREAIDVVPQAVE